MGASKTNQYSQEIKDLSLIARALGHPARAQIVSVLKSQPFTRNTDLTSILQLSKSSIFEHVTKLVQADLVKLSFEPNCYHITLIPERLEELKELIE
ncbi:MAG TPA: winged helix-turn-helix domain-containing protein [Fluviicola sp.]|nr:winged helix-turn-helix domain-containing protein [Fluviicola sp.]